MKLHRDFLAGRYRATVERLLDENAAPPDEGSFVSVLGALSFLGRIDEAEAYFGAHANAFGGMPVIAGRFFLAIGWTRRSEYERSRRLFEKNRAEAGPSSLEQFFVHQGGTFFAYYTGRYAQALAEAAKSQGAAFAAKNYFARCLSSDSLGHCHVVAGEIHQGLRYLKEAEQLAKRLGNESLRNSIAISQMLYQAEFGIDGERGLLRLEKRLKSAGTEANYSLSNVALELARQYTLRGRYADAAITLERAAPIIYSNQNRRHQILLNLRLAELAGRQGDFFLARHYLWFSRRLLHLEVDESLELATLGIERKLALAENQPVAEIDARWAKLHEFASTRDRNLRVRVGLLPPSEENPEDIIHHTLRLAQGDGRARGAERLIEAGLLAEASLRLGLPPGREALAVFPTGFLAQTRGGLVWRESKLSRFQHRILRLMGKSADLRKETLLEKVWGYRYDPLRHDSMIYAAMSALRKALGPAGEWLIVTENGYRFTAVLQWAAEEGEAAPVAVPALPDHELELNHRQIEILEWLQGRRFIGVAECRERFRVSDITALRDLDGLRTKGLVVRIGRARATKYALAAAGGSP